MRVALQVPEAVRARSGERLPVVVHLDGEQRREAVPLIPYFGGLWTFDLRRVAGFGAGRR